MRRGSTVAVEYPDVFTHWLLLLACERLGACSLSWVAEEIGTPLPFLAEVDLVLSQQAPPPEAIDRHRPITDDWMRQVAALPPIDPEPAVSWAPEDPLRILRTSGTTGAAKRISITHCIHAAWLSRWLWFGGLTNRSRFLVTMPFTVGGGYASASAALRAGGTVVIDAAARAHDAIAAHGITHTVLPPIHLKNVLDALPADFAKPAELKVFSFGAPVAGTLRERAAARLASELHDLYGSNEAGFISSRRSAEHALGTLWPGVEVEIVDDDDRPLPQGRLGRIRVRNDWLVAGYLDEPEATAKAFRHGWFHPGDAGVLHGGGRLEVVGRADELLNIGWIKLSPDVVEARILQMAPVGDVGACALPDREGIGQVCIAVAEPRVADRELLERVSAAFEGLQLGSIRFVKLERIPRNANGKIRRKALEEAVAAATPLR